MRLIEKRTRTGGATDRPPGAARHRTDGPVVTRAPLLVKRGRGAIAASGSDHRSRGVVDRRAVVASL
jgi:hypothetical protein